MFRVTAHLKSLSPYGPSRDHRIKRNENESFDDFEDRTYRDKAHSLPDGRVFVPPMALKFGIASAAKFMGERMPGRGRATWTSHFASGVLCMTPVMLPIMKDDLPGEWFFVHVDGRRDSGSRVWKKFPVVPEWEANVEFFVLDVAITQKVFLHHLDGQGKFVGIGRFRPQTGGFYGRFKVVDMDWKDED